MSKEDWFDVKWIEALTYISKNLEDTDHYLLKKLLQIEEGEIRTPLHDEALPVSPAGL